MISLARTFSTRIDEHPAIAARAAIECHVERKLLAALRSGRKFKGDLAVSFYQQFGISAKSLDNIHRQLTSKLKAISELAKNQAENLENKIRAKRKKIEETSKAIARETKRGGDPRTLRHDLHQYKRKLTSLEFDFKKTVRRIAEPHICFGTAKLFNAQHHLQKSGYESHAAWLKAWRSARSDQFFMEGDRQFAGGNQFARLKARTDGTFDLELRLPKCLSHLAERSISVKGKTASCIDIAGLRFPHGDAEIREALLAEKPLSFRFQNRNDGTWTVSVIILQEFTEADAKGTTGALGIDINADHVALTLADACGNPVMSKRIPLVLYGRSRDQRLDIIRKAAAEIGNIAIRLKAMIVAEKLDFARKKAELQRLDGAQRSQGLTNFAYANFAKALQRVCARKSIGLILVNPAYTSLIGRVKFVPRYGLSVHAAAALSIARRGMGLSERLPATCGIILADGDRVTLERPARIARRHVWSSWSKLAHGLSAAHAGRRQARRTTRSHGTRALPVPWGRGMLTIGAPLPLRG